MAGALVPKPHRRPLQYRLKYPDDNKRLVMEGEGRSARYKEPKPVHAAASFHVKGTCPVQAIGEAGLPLSPDGHDIQVHVSKPLMERTPIGYNRAFLDSCRPNKSFCLSVAGQAALHEIAMSKIAPQPAGADAKLILNRLLIDLSWNSSRPEGNTYSLLDTQRLIDLGEEAEGREAIQKIADLFCFPGHAVQALARRAAARMPFAYWCMHFQAR